MTSKAMKLETPTLSKKVKTVRTETPKAGRKTKAKVKPEPVQKAKVTGTKNKGEVRRVVSKAKKNIGSMLCKKCKTAQGVRNPKTKQVKAEGDKEPTGVLKQKKVLSAKQASALDGIKHVASNPSNARASSIYITLQDSSEIQKLSAKLESIRLQFDNTGLNLKSPYVESSQVSEPIPHEKFSANKPEPLQEIVNKNDNGENDDVIERKTDDKDSGENDDVIERKTDDKDSGENDDVIEEKTDDKDSGRDDEAKENSDEMDNDQVTKIQSEELPCLKDVTDNRNDIQTETPNILEIISTNEESLNILTNTLVCRQDTGVTNYQDARVMCLLNKQESQESRESVRIWEVQSSQHTSESGNNETNRQHSRDRDSRSSNEEDVSLSDLESSIEVFFPDENSTIETCDDPVVNYLNWGRNSDVVRVEFPAICTHIMGDYSYDPAYPSFMDVGKYFVQILRGIINVCNWPYGGNPI